MWQKGIGEVKYWQMYAYQAIGSDKLTNHLLTLLV